MNPLGRFVPWLFGSALLLLVGIMAFSFRLVGPDFELDLDQEARLAVLPLKNSTGERENDWVRLGMMELFAETLRRTSGLDIVAPDRLAAALRARGLDSEEEGSRRRVSELARALGAELILDIEVSRAQARDAPEDGLYSLRFEVSGDAGQILGRGELAGADPARIADRLCYLVAGALAGRTEPVTLNRVFSASPFLNRLYGMGVARLYEDGDASAALPFFEIALAIEPGFLAGRYRQADGARRRGRLEESRRLFLKLVEESQNRGERVWEARALHALALVEAFSGRADEAVKLATQLRTHAFVKRDPSARLAVLRDLARFALAQGETERAGELFEEARTLQQELGDRLGRIDTETQLGALALGRGDLDRAVRSFNEARALAGDLGDVRTEMQVLASLGEVASRGGNLADAVELWRRAAAFYDQRGEARRRALLLRQIADTLIQMEDLKAAEDAFQDARELAIELGDDALEALASLRLTWILLRSGYPYQARTHLSRAIELDELLDQPLTLQRMIAWMAYEEGNYRLAVDTLRTVKRQAGEGWRELDESFLEVFVSALERGERLPVPGEKDVLGPG